MSLGSSPAWAAVTFWFLRREIKKKNPTQSVQLLSTSGQHAPQHRRAEWRGWPFANEEDFLWWVNSMIITLLLAWRMFLNVSPTLQWPLGLSRSFSSSLLLSSPQIVLGFHYQDKGHLCLLIYACRRKSWVRKKQDGGWLLQSVVTLIHMKYSLMLFDLFKPKELYRGL